MSDEKAAAAPKKKLNLVIILVPIAVVAALVLVFALPVTHAIIVNGPLKPVFARLGLAPATPHGAKGDKSTATVADPAADIKRLGDELDAARKTEAVKDAKIAQLQSEVAGSQAATSADAAPTPIAKPSPTAVPEAIKRTAIYWSGMDAEKAADVAARLPDAYVKSIFAQMPADAVAEIMNAMPAKIAAKLTAAGDAADQP